MKSDQETTATAAAEAAKPKNNRKQAAKKPVGRSAAGTKPAAGTGKQKTAKKKAAAKRAKSAAIVMPNPLKRQRAIEQIAYHLSLARGFTPGFEESDWLTAETIIEQLHAED